MHIDFTTRTCPIVHYQRAPNQAMWKILVLYWERSIARIFQIGPLVAGIKIFQVVRKFREARATARTTPPPHAVAAGQTNKKTKKRKEAEVRTIVPAFHVLALVALSEE